jgi:hypothetical protein
MDRLSWAVSQTRPGEVMLELALWPMARNLRGLKWNNPVRKGCIVFSMCCCAKESSMPVVHTTPFVYTILKEERERESSLCCSMVDQAERSIGMHFVAWWAGPGRALTHAPSHDGPNERSFGMLGRAVCWRAWPGSALSDCARHGFGVCSIAWRAKPDQAA